jgi:Ca2+-binding RTX toxin-like protein
MKMIRRFASDFAQPLEGRTLFYNFALSSGILVLQADDTSQDLVVERLNESVRVTLAEAGTQLTQQDFPLASITGIDVRLGAGNDYLKIATAVRIPATIGGGAGNDTIFGGGSNDSIAGGDGDDLLDGRSASDRLSGGNGTDTVDYSLRTENLALSIDDVANDGAAGEFDNILGDVENIFAGSGNDTLVGSNFDNLLLGNNGRDLVNGGDGNDTLAGGKLQDTLRGGNDDDELAGGSSNDQLFPGTGRDTILGGSQFDTASYADRSDDLNLSLDGTANDGATGENDFIETDVEHLVGGSGNDILTGDGRPNQLSGNAGNDILTGGSGDDTLTGGPGLDQLFGQRGNDWFFANDGEGDTLNGSGGVDVDAESDSNDVFVDIP